MWGRAQVLVLLTALLAYGDDVQDAAAIKNELKIGRAIDMFPRYGYLSLSMRVVPRNESDSWLFREPTIDIFNNVERYAEREPKQQQKKGVFAGDFHMEFCDNVKLLMQAYFRDFNFERLDRPWRAFTSSWTIEAISRNLGINSSFVLRDHCYVLVRLSRFRESVKLSRIPNNINLAEEVAREIDNIKVGNVTSVLNFIKKYGSHYIDSYVTGNSIYQVFVFKRTNYYKIKDRLKAQGIKHLTNLELERFFSPWTAQHIGEIKVASGNGTVQKWATQTLRIHDYIFHYPTILKVRGDPYLLSILNNLLQNEAILKIDFKSLAPAFKDPSKRDWFEEVLDNFTKLWESNL